MSFKALNKTHTHTQKRWRGAGGREREGEKLSQVRPQPPPPTVQKGNIFGKRKTKHQTNLMYVYDNV